MRRLVRLLLLALALPAAAWIAPPPARADDAAALRQLYAAFYTAQNRRDLPAVRALLDDAAGFLWVSDGTAFWGADEMIARMSQFQSAEVWRVEPDLAAARTTLLAPGVGHLHLPLAVWFGAAAEPKRFPFLVTMVGRATPAGWRIAALLTTTPREP